MALHDCRLSTSNYVDLSSLFQTSLSWRGKLNLLRGLRSNDVRKRVRRHAGVWRDVIDPRSEAQLRRQTLITSKARDQRDHGLETGVPNEPSGIR